MNFLFGQFELDANGYKLRREGSEVALQPKVFDAIRYLVEHHDRVVRKEELLEALWPGEHVNETAVPWTISRARKALGQGPEAKDPIETVRGRGYRFTAEVTQVQPTAPGPASAKVLRLETEAASSPWIAATMLATPSNDPFVGRAEPMERLLGALHGARNGRGRLCLLTGDAGIGKTRCVGEFASVARRLRLGVSSGRCLEGGRTAAFWPWVQVLRDALGEDSLSAQLKLEVRSLLSELVPRSDTIDIPIDPDATNGFGARFWVLEKLSRHLLEVRRRLAASDSPRGRALGRRCLARSAGLPGRRALASIRARGGHGPRDPPARLRSVGEDPPPPRPVRANRAVGVEAEGRRDLRRRRSPG